MVEAKNKGSSNWWWLQAQNDKGLSNRTPWLQSTLSELDEKTKTMLKLIEEDADSFAQRADMYYKKRPELISMVEDFYRTHRLLVEKYDQVKSESPARNLSSPWSSPRAAPTLSLTKFRLEKPANLFEKTFDCYSEVCGPEESDESDVDDPEEEIMHEQLESEIDELSSGSMNEELMRLSNEVERLRNENKAQTEELKQKDEEKREVIRQLSLAMDLLREENMELKKNASKKNVKKESSHELNKVKENFFGKLFSGFNKSLIVAL